MCAPVCPRAHRYVFAKTFLLLFCSSDFLLLIFFGVCVCVCVKDTYYSEAQKKALADRKSDNPIEYDAYLAEHFTKTIYKGMLGQFDPPFLIPCSLTVTVAAHVDAYSKCCCPSGTVLPNKIR